MAGSDLSTLPRTDFLEKKLNKDMPEKSDLTGTVMFDSKRVDPDTESYTVNDAFGTTRFVRGEPVITTGADVSNYAVDVRDDGDEALTFRSFFIGTVVAGLGAALAEASAQRFGVVFGTE